MDKVKDIMEKLGFREDGSDSVKAAFLQNLIYQAYGVRVNLPAKYADVLVDEPVQLNFNLDDVG